MAASLYIYRHGGFPPASKYLDKIWQDRNHKKHKKRLKNVKGQLDLTPPRNNMHLQIQLNKLHMEQERQAAIDKQNLVIIEKLTEIKKSPGRIDHMNKTWKPSNDRMKRFRERRQRRIEQENRLQAQRLKKVQSYYDTDEWEKDYKKHLYYMSMMENTTKDYDYVEYKDDEKEKSSEENSDEDGDDTESLPPVPPGTPEKDKKERKSSDEEDNISLPPIDDKQGKKKDKEKDDSYSEQDAIMDAEELRTAVKDENKEKILEILGRTSEREKLQELRDKYQEMYDKDLMEDVKPSLDEEAQGIFQSLSSSAAEEDARKLNDAIKGLGTDEDTIIEILCTRNNKELEAIREEYHIQFDQSLEEDLKGDTSGDVEKILVELSKGQREEAEEEDKIMAKRDAENLIEAGVGSWGTDEGEFIRIFTQRSLPQLAAMYPEYEKLAKMGIEESIDNEMDGDLQKTFLALVKHSRNPTGVQEDKMYKAIKDGDTKTVAQIILPMNKAQLAKLCSTYKKNNKTDIVDDIEKKCSGDLKQMLLAKLGKEAGEKKKEKGKKDSIEKGKEREKLPAIGKKKEQEKKGEKKQEKKSETAKEEQDTSQKDIEELYQAVQDKNKNKIIDILSKNVSDNKKLQKLQDKYQKEYEHGLLDAIKSVADEEELEDPLECLFVSAPEYEAKCLYEATKGIGTDEDLLIEILCTRSGSQLTDIQEAYRKKYGTTLEDDIKSDTSGDFEDLLLELLKSGRDESDKVDKVQAKKDAEALHQAGAKRFGTDEKTFISILTKRSPAQLNAAFSEYKKLAKVEIEESIEKEMTGDLEKGLVILVKCMRNPSQFYSNKLHSLIQGGDISTAARIILTSDKAKLTETMNEYKKANHSSLDADVQKKCSEMLKKLLMAKMGKGVGKAKDSPQHKGNQGKGKDTSKDKGKSSPSKQASPGKKQTEATKGKKEDETSQLHKAIQAEDKKKVKEIVLRNATDKPKLKKLSDDYKKQHNQHLVEALESNIDDDLLEAVSGLLLPPSQADARTLHSAMKGVGTNEAILIEILCPRTNAEIQSIKKDYKKQYSKSLEEDVKSETSGDFEKLLVALLQGKRDESKSVNDDQAHKDAETLIEAGIKTWGTDEDKFIDIFTTRSIPQLQAMLPEYNKWAKCDIEESITSEMDGDLQAALLTLVACIRDPVKNQADKIYGALLDGDTSTVARIIAGSNEASLKKLESTYNTNYKPKLFNEVDKKCSPELKKIILQKLKDKNQEKTTHKTKAEPKKQAGAAGSPKKKEEKDDECCQLHNAIEKKDKKKIKEIAIRNAVDKNKIKKLSDDYQQRYNKDLVDVLDSKMEDDLHEAITALLLPPTQADARTLFYAMKGIGTKETLVMEILCTRNNEEISEIKSEYMKKYGRSLAEDVKGDTTDDFEKLLTDLLKGARDESTEIDEELVQKDATDLYNAGVKIWGTHEDKFIEILTSRSGAHLKAMLGEYNKLAGVELEESIKDEMDGDLQDGLITLLSCIRDECKAMADQLYMSLQDHDTGTVARIIAGTEQGKMTDIETTYNMHHRPKIYSEVNKKCSEDVKKIILPKLKDKKQEKEKHPQKAQGVRKTSVVKKQSSKNPAAPAAAAAVSKEKGEDCSLLYRAIKNEEKKKFTEIVVRNATDKSKIKKLSDDYNKRYKKILVEELDSKVEDDIHEAMTVLLLPPSQADARALYYAMKGIGTHEIHLIEILSTKSNEEMIEIKKEYQEKYGRSLEEDVKYQTSGDFENLLTALMKGIRDDSTKVNQELARADATELYNAGVKMWGTDEDKFIEILTSRSSAHVKAMLGEYSKLAGVELEESIKDEMDACDLQDGLIILLSSIQDECKAMADQLYTALQDHDTSTVARVIVGTEQKKLSTIEASYNSAHKPSLYDEVDKTCSDDLKKIILPKLEDESDKSKGQTHGKSRKISQDSKRKSSVRRSSKQSESSDKKTENEKIEEENEDDNNKGRPKIDVKKIEYHGTIVAAKNFDAARNAERLKKAMKGYGSDEGVIIGVLTACTSSQRQEIAASFQEQYEKDLVDELKSELSGKFEEAIVGLMSSPAVYDANMLYSAMKGIGTKDSLLTEIICSRTSKEIQEIKEAYKTVYGKDVIEEVQDETSGDFRSVLIALLQGKRASSDTIDEEDAYEDAKRLLEAGEKRWETDESVFIDILTTRSSMQLRAIFQAYKHVSNKDILESIDDELEGDFHDAVRTIVLCASDPPKYFAECLHSAMNGMMTNNAAVTRIIIARSEIDLIEIKSAYIDQFGNTLEAEVKDTFKGDQEGLLLKLLGDE